MTSGVQNCRYAPGVLRRSAGSQGERLPGNILSRCPTARADSWARRGHSPDSTGRDLSSRPRESSAELAAQAVGGATPRHGRERTGGPEVPSSNLGSPTTKVLVTTPVGPGPRRSRPELVTGWSQADQAGCLSRVRPSRTARRRTMSAYASFNDEDALFTGIPRIPHRSTEDGSPVHPQVMTRRFRGLADRAGLPPLRLHNLRHAWATNALAAGVDIGDVSRRVGHASIRTTFHIYTAPSSERDALAANAVARLYG